VRAEHRQQTVKYVPKVFWDFFTASGPGSLVPVDGMINSSKYIEILKSKSFAISADVKGTLQHDIAACRNSKAVKKFI
jgi:hypothetical protein